MKAKVYSLNNKKQLKKSTGKPLEKNSPDTKSNGTNYKICVFALLNRKIKNRLVLSSLRNLTLVNKAILTWF